MKESIHYEEKILQEKYNLKVHLYGSGRQGYNKTCDYLYHDTQELTGNILRTLHAYWTFLILVHKYAMITNFNKLPEEKIIFYRPQRKHGRATAILDFASFFIEPSLKVYDREQMHDEWNDLKLLSIGKHLSTRPDIVVADATLTQMPLSAWRNIPGFISSDNENMGRLYKEYSHKIKLIVKCKHDIIRRDDLNRFLWYAVAYQKPIALICQKEIPQEYRRDFIADINHLRGENIPVYLIENFRIGEKERCLEKLEEIVR